jgi:misacylated tRNA(Ala) deacylase
MSEALFRDDAYLKDCAATVTGVNERGGIILDRTVFYAAGGGQPGDSGEIELDDGRMIQIATTVYGEDRADIVHMPAEPGALPAAGATVNCRLDWARRYGHMRIHTALHLLSAVLPYPVTGGQVGADTGRLDFDIPDAALADKEEIAERLNALIDADYPVGFEWITDAELAAKPELVKTMAVKPPMGSGHIRLVRIGTDVDLQPCGGTHVRSTAEIGPIAVTKIEKKGAKNRRVRIAFA